MKVFLFCLFSSLGLAQNVKDKIFAELTPRILEVLGEVLMNGNEVVENIKKDSEICGNFDISLEKRIAQLEDYFYANSEDKDKERCHGDAVRDCTWFQQKFDILKTMDVKPSILKEALSLAYDEDLLGLIRNVTISQLNLLVERNTGKKD